MRKILGIYSAPRPHWVGDGFHVRSMISPQLHGEHLSPFIMLDYAAPETFAPTKHRRGVGQHPHRGFETVTIVYDGELEHRDSTGAGGTIGPGDVQWMTAAGGILHEEFHSNSFAEKGGNMEMVQLWVNLPAKHKNAEPGYQTLLAKDIPSVELPGKAGTVRVIAGDFDGDKGPARTFTPINVWDVRLNRDKSAKLALPEGHSLAVIVLAGTVEVNGAEVVRTGQLVVLSREGGEITLEANGDAKLLVLSGEPINEPVVAHGPFVMNTIGEIKQAMLDFEAGKFGQMYEQAS
ncbi:MAG: pirin family protein [Hyphomicrobiaceae bacterium]|nr:pirin family protein [Hyphomicrobiaceae bacterium]MCC0010823.1 pirin family protein [Hyphomicrobiaceae bacterium]